ncbi:MAG: glucosaminidase domain-containing protein [Thermodesulfobacteriota bacterium]
MVRMVVGVSLAALLLLMVGLQPVATAIAPQPVDRAHMIPTVKVKSASALLNQLKVNNLWDVAGAAEVPAVLITRLPADFNTLDQQTQKKAFLHTLLPVAMVAISEVENEREALEQVLGKFASLPHRFDFSGHAIDETLYAGLNGEDISLLQHLCEKYQTFDVATLRSRINPVPVSLVLAQGALESAWGSSRLALEGNNLFGVGAWGGSGLMTPGKDNNKVASYATLLDAVRAYVLMLNRVPAYDDFREKREQTMDSITLAQGLRYYSERREEYVADVARLIRNNQLQVYDRCELADTSFLRGGKQPRLNLASLR